MKRLAVPVAAAVLPLALGATALAAGLGFSSKTLTAFAKVLASPVTCTLVGAPSPSATVADSYVRQDAASTNYGTSTTLDVGSGTSSRRFSLVRFDLSTCGLPAGANVTSASLRLVLVAAPAASRQYQVFRVGGAWSETAVTWNTRPPIVSAATAATTLASNMSAAATSMTLTDAGVFPAPPFLATVESEVVRVGTRSGNVLSGLTRGYFGSSSGSHGIGAPVTLLTPTATVSTGTTAGVVLTANVLYDVQAFVTGTATNYGWRVDDADELTAQSGQLGSRESTTPANRPQLTVTYVS